MPRSSSAKPGKRKLPPPIPRRAQRPDWTWIRAEWESDLKSDRQIAEQSTKAGRKVSHVAIGKKARLQGWAKKPMGVAVRREVERKLAEAAVSTVSTDASHLIDAAARQGVEVIREHRADIGRALRISKTLLTHLEDAIAEPLEMAKAVEEETRPDVDGGRDSINLQAKRRERLMRTIGLADQVAVLKDLAQVQRTLIGLERIAHNLNDKDAAPDSIEERLAQLERGES